MTTLFELLSGKEEEILNFFKEKYNLVEKEVKEVAELLEHHENQTTPPPIPTSAPNVSNDPHNIQGAFQNRPATETNKVTKGIGNLFGGTVWGKK
jgi:hypothetical protein